MIVHDKRNPKGDFSSLAFVAMNKTLVALFREIFMSSVQLSFYLRWRHRPKPSNCRICFVCIRRMRYDAAMFFSHSHLSCGHRICTNGRISRWIRHQQRHEAEWMRCQAVKWPTMNRSEQKKLSLEQTTRVWSKKMLRKQINYRRMLAVP